MAILREEFVGVTNTFTIISGAIRKAQSILITGAVPYPVGDVAIYGDAAEDEGDLMIEVRSNDGSNRPGVLLGSGFVSKTQVRVESEGFHVISIDVPFTVTPGAIVHVVAYVTAGTMYWRMRQTEPTYAGGGPCTSADNGVTWTGPVDAVDRFFQLWEYEPPVEPPLVELDSADDVVGLKLLPSRSSVLTSLSLLMRKVGAPGITNYSIYRHKGFSKYTRPCFHVEQIQETTIGDLVCSGSFGDAGLDVNFAQFTITPEESIEVFERGFLYILFSCATSGENDKVQFSIDSGSYMYERVLESVDGGNTFSVQALTIPYFLYGTEGYIFSSAEPR